MAAINNEGSKTNEAIPSSKVVCPQCKNNTNDMVYCTLCRGMVVSSDASDGSYKLVLQAAVML